MSNTQRFNIPESDNIEENILHHYIHIGSRIGRTMFDRT